MERIRLYCGKVTPKNSDYLPWGNRRQSRFWEYRKEYYPITIPGWVKQWHLDSRTTLQITAECTLWRDE